MSQSPEDTFRQEARDLLEALEQTLLDLERSPDDRDLVDAAFRALHTIKGSGAMFGFDQVAAFVHDFETAFDTVRKSNGPVQAGIVAVALSALDYIRTLIEDPAATDPVIGEALLAELHGHLGQAGPAGAPDPMPVEEAAPAAAGEAEWHLVLRFRPDVLVNGTNPLLLLEELRGLGSCATTPLLDAVPDLETLDPTTCLLAWDVRLTTSAPRQAIEDVFMFAADEMDLLIEPATPAAAEAPAAASVSVPPPAPAPLRATPPAGEPAPAAPARKDPAPSSRPEGQAASVRVAADRLDALMDRVGELVIAQARLSQMAAAHHDIALIGVAEEIERLAAGLRDTTMGIRMVPIATLFGRFRRLLFDLSRDLGKPLELVTSGEETELDKTMIERLADPLVHLIRNAVDHGLETPAERLAAGKAEGGAIRLTARHVGAEVQIRVSDDGRGLDAERIRAKAVEQGLISAEARPSEAEIHQFLFHPGFSTAREISALSGRGVGMDVVKRVIEGMRGTIDLATRKGQGTDVTLRLPLTLAIIEGLLVRVGGSRYIIPLACVEECVELAAVEDSRSRGRSFLRIRDDLVPFIRLRQRFAEEGEPDPYQKVVVVTAGESRVGLVVDQIIGQHQTVIKTLSPLHAHVPTFSGATILGDGSAALILDVASLVEAGQAEGGPSGPVPSKEAA